MCAITLAFTTTACGTGNQTMNNAGGTMNNAMGNAGGFVGNAANGTAGFVGNAANGTAGLAGNAANGAAGLAGNAANGTAGLAGNAVNGVAGLAGRVVDGVTTMLPRSIAGAPTNLSIPKTTNPAQIKAVQNGRRIHVVARAHWRGKMVRVYYIPATDLNHRGTHVDLINAHGAQRIGEFPINQQGHWSGSWNMGNYRVPAHKSLYFLAVSDANQVALVRTDTIS